MITRVFIGLDLGGVKQNQEVITMKQKYNAQLFAIASIVIGLNVSVSAHAAGSNGDIDKVLGELTRQHNSSSNLVKNTRQPASLALSSTLVNPPKANKTGGNNVLGQLTAVASSTVSKFKQTGTASWYGRQFHGRKTTSGESFDMNGFTAAHSTLPMNCYIKVTNKDNGKSVVVKVNDRASFKDNRILDLSYGAAKAIGMTQKGTGNVSIERVDAP